MVNENLWAINFWVAHWECQFVRKILIKILGNYKIDSCLGKVLYHCVGRQKILTLSSICTYAQIKQSIHSLVIAQLSSNVRTSGYNLGQLFATSCFC